jgi:hypothetical protein
MDRKLLFSVGTILLTSKICFFSPQNDISKNLKLVIYPCFLDDFGKFWKILDNSYMCQNELITILNGTSLDQIHDFLTNIHVFIVIGFWQLDLNQ